MGLFEWRRVIFTRQILTLDVWKEPIFIIVCRDAMMLPLLNCGTSVLAGLVVFSILGFLAQETGRDVSEVVTQGQYDIK